MFAFLQTADEETRSLACRHLQKLVDSRHKELLSQWRQWQLANFDAQHSEQLEERANELEEDAAAMEQAVEEQNALEQQMAALIAASAASDSEQAVVRGLREAVAEQATVEATFAAEVEALEREVQELEQAKVAAEAEHASLKTELEQAEVTLQEMGKQQLVVTELEETHDLLGKLTIWQLCPEGSGVPNEILALAATHPDGSKTDISITKGEGGSHSVAASFAPASTNASAMVAALVRSVRCEQLFGEFSSSGECLRALQQADVLLTRMHGVMDEISALEKQFNCSCTPHASEDGIVFSITFTQAPCKSQFRAQLHIGGAYPYGGLQLNELTVMYGKVSLRRRRSRSSSLTFQPPSSHSPVLHFCSHDSVAPSAFGCRCTQVDEAAIQRAIEDCGKGHNLLTRACHAIAQA